MLVRQAPSSEKRDDNLKIIDFERKGNLVRFYLGSDSVEDYSGEGWERVPYSQAETVDAKYIAGIADCVFPSTSWFSSQTAEKRTFVTANLT